MPEVGEEQWVAPASLAEADERWRDVVSRVEQIHAQLGDRDRRSEYDSDAEYEDWRWQAKLALRHFQNENRRLKAWKGERGRMAARDPSLTSSEAVEQAFALARRMQALVALQTAVGDWLVSGSEVPDAVTNAYRAVPS